MKVSNKYPTMNVKVKNYIRHFCLIFIIFCQFIHCCIDLDYKADNINITILGDTRTGFGIEKLFIDTPIINISNVKSYLNFLKPDLILHTGDIVKLGSKKSEWKIFNKVFRKFIKTDTQPAFFPVIGNHDLDVIAELGLKYYFETFHYLNNQRWYCLLINKKILVLSLDSNVRKLNNTDIEMQNKFIKDTLSKFSNSYKLLIVNFHHPIFKSLKKYKLAKWFSRNFKDTLYSQNKQTLFVNGHFHNFFYQKFDENKRLIITGGAGAPLHKFIPGFLNKHHFVLLKINLKVNTVRIKTLIFKSAKRFYFTNIDTFKLPVDNDAITK